MSSRRPISWYARRYVEKFGFHLVPIEPGRKFPRSASWGNNAISDPDQAAAFWESHPDWNMGVALGPSRMCSLDIDCDASFAHICEEYGIAADALDGYPTIQGSSKGRRVMFRVPDGVDLCYQKMNWPSSNDPTGQKHRDAMAAATEARSAGDTDREARIRAAAKRWSSYTVFELRSSCDGKQRQDVLPPSIHPDTGQPYKWLSQPAHNWPEPPAWLLAIWNDWDKFKPQVSAMCPWLPAEKTAPVKLSSRAKKAPAIGGNVISAFLDAHDLESTLERFGYQRKGRTRFLSPHSGTGLPGVVVLPDGDACWVHHASDPMCSDETGKPVNAFDLFCAYEHGGDIKAAVKSAAKLLGMDSRVQHNEQSEAVAPASASAPTVEHASAPSRDYVSPLPWTNDKGVPLNNIDNTREICRRLGVTIRYNVIKKQEEIIIPGQSFSMDNEANASLAWLLSEFAMFKMSTSKITEFMTYLADCNQFNPVERWVSSKPWDGRERLEDFFATITAVGEDQPGVIDLKKTLMRRWMIASIAAAFLPDGISGPGVLTLQGDQYLGKTKWFKSLVPEDLELVVDGMILRPDDKDSVKQCLSYWLVELGELDSTFRKSDVAQLKAFLTKKSDTLRMAYARRESKFPRRTMFFASVNPRDFLHDPTGNRRFWTIECAAINHSHDLDMQQVWAEFLTIWRSGEGYYLSPEEMTRLNSHNEDFTGRDPVEERLLTGLNWSEPETIWRWAQATDVLMECGVDRPTKSDLNTASAFIRKQNGGRSRRTKTHRLLFCPNRAR